jgi:hypothetical protein
VTHYSTRWGWLSDRKGLGSPHSRRYSGRLAFKSTRIAERREPYRSWWRGSAQYPTGARLRRAGVRAAAQQGKTRFLGLTARRRGAGA